MKIRRIVSTALCLVALCATRPALSEMSEEMKAKRARYESMTPKERHAYEHEIVRGKLDAMTGRTKSMPVDMDAMYPSGAQRDAHVRGRAAYNEREQLIASLINQIPQGFSDFRNGSKKLIDSIIMQLTVLLGWEETDAIVASELVAAGLDDEPYFASIMKKEVQPKKMVAEEVYPSGAQQDVHVRNRTAYIQKQQKQNLIDQMEGALAKYQLAKEGKLPGANLDALMGKVGEAHKELASISTETYADAELQKLVTKYGLNPAKTPEQNKQKQEAKATKLAARLLSLEQALDYCIKNNSPESLDNLNNTFKKMGTEFGPSEAGLGLMAMAIKLGLIKDGTVIATAPQIVKDYKDATAKTAQWVLTKALSDYGLEDDAAARTKMLNNINNARVLLEQLIGTDKAKEAYTEILTDLVNARSIDEAEKTKLLGDSGLSTLGILASVAAGLGAAYVLPTNEAIAATVSGLSQLFGAAGAYLPKLW